MAAVGVRSGSLSFACPTRSFCRQEVSVNSSEQARTPASFAMQKVEGSSLFRHADAGFTLRVYARDGRNEASLS